MCIMWNSLEKISNSMSRLQKGETSHGDSTGMVQLVATEPSLGAEGNSFCLSCCLKDTS